jgi:arylsulfatase A-like enzyme
MYDPRDVVLPEHRTRDLDNRPWWYRASLEGTPQLSDPAMRNLRVKVSRLPDQSDEQLAHMTANYYGMISLIDHNVGRIRSALDDMGLRENTLVIFTTDHGEMLGNHGLYLKGPWPLEDLLRVNMIAAGPDVGQSSVVEEPVSTVDLAPTFLDYAGVSAQLGPQGCSLRTLLQGGAEKREAAYSEWHVHPSRCGVGLQLRTVRTKTHKCTVELNSGAGELYDLVNDPQEIHNRFDDPGYRKLRTEFNSLIQARPGKIRDDLSEPIGMA